MATATRVRPRGARDLRPNLRGLDDLQQHLALAHWHLWLLWPRFDEIFGAAGPTMQGALHVLENEMQPETLHRVALAKGRYWQEGSKYGNPTS